MPLYQWSTTPASNASAGAIDWAEGQPPSTVNDSARQMMADVATWFAAPEWLNYGLTPTYSSGTVYTLAGNQTAIHSVGRRVRTFNTGGTVYGTIATSVYTTITTVTITPDSGSLDSGLSEVDVGILNPANTSVPNGNPPGTILSFAGSSMPAGYLLADGSAVSRTNFAALFSAIGTTYGVGDGSTTFNLPDGRGVVMRGLDNGRGFDPGRTLGTYQADSFASHNHGINDPQHTHPSAAAVSGNQTLAPGVNGAAINGTNTGSASTGITIQNTGGAETRGKNLAVNMIIKF